MSRTTLAFIYASLFYLFLGSTLGVFFFLAEGARSLRTVHAHWNLVGFVTFMVFGISYHILPRFRGRPLHSERLGWWHFWLANIGLAGMTLFLALDAYLPSNFRTPEALFASVLALSIFLFIYNLGRTLLEPIKEA